MKTPVIGLLLILMMKKEGEATTTTTTTTMATTPEEYSRDPRMGTSTEEDSRELRKIGREEIDNDINEARMAEITNILITELTNMPDAENMEEGLRILRNQGLKRKLKTHTGEKVQELTREARAIVQFVEKDVEQEEQVAPSGFEITVVEKGRKIYLQEVREDKFPTQVLRCARRDAQVWTPMSKKTLNDIFRNQLPREREKRRREEVQEQTVVEGEPEDNMDDEEEEETEAGEGETAGTDILNIQSGETEEIVDLGEESSEDWYVSKENLWHLLLDRDLDSELPGIPDEERGAKLGISMTSCLKLRVRTDSIDTDYQNVKCRGKGAGKHLTFCMKEGEDIEGRQLLNQTLHEVPFKNIIQEWGELHYTINEHVWTKEETIRWTMQNIRIENNIEEIKEQLKVEEKGMNFKRIKATLNEMRQNMRNGINEARNKERTSAHNTLQGKTEGIEREVQDNARTMKEYARQVNKNNRIIERIRTEKDEDKEKVERIDKSLVQTKHALTKMQHEAEEEVRKLTTTIDNVAETMTSGISNEVRTQLRRQKCPQECENRINDILIRNEERRNEERRENRDRPIRTTEDPDEDRTEENETPAEKQDEQINEGQRQTGANTTFADHICDRQNEENWAECIMREVKEYFEGETEWIPWATLGAFLIVSTMIAITCCKTRSLNKRINRLEQICKREIQQLKRRKREGEIDTEEDSDSELQTLAPKQGRMFVTTSTQMIMNQQSIIMIIMEITNLLEKTNTQPTDKWPILRVTGITGVATEEGEQDRRGNQGTQQERNRR